MTIRRRSRPGTQQMMPQLNETTFAECLALASPPGFIPLNLLSTRTAYNLSLADGLLLYLALYAGNRRPELNATQQLAFDRWSPPFWKHESSLARRLNDSAGVVTPGFVFGVAVSSCQKEYNLGQAALCAALTTHNVLRALGRSWTFVDRHGTNYLPPWYRADPDAWQATAARLKTSQLISLQRDGGGCGSSSNNDLCWGEWYHTFGVIAFGIHEAALLGERAGDLASLAVAALNTIYTVVIGGREDPHKSRIDNDAAAVGVELVGLQGRVPGQRDVCATRAGYVRSSSQEVI